MNLPRLIMERVERLHSYHQRTKLMAMGSRHAPPADPAFRPVVHRVFADLPKIALPTTLLDASIGTLTLLAAGQDALPDSLKSPPQDLRTLASWLYYSMGETKRTAGRAVSCTRAYPEADANLSFELYVAAFAIEGLDPGLYHFSPREFSLRKLRDGAATLMQIKKGRPDLEFIKTFPAGLIVTSTYWRSVYRFGRRAYRSMLLEAGQAVQNLVAAGAGLGAQTITRLRMNDLTMRELIGVTLDEPMPSAECVQAMVLWADPAQKPMDLTGATTLKMPAIARPPLAARVLDDEAATESLFMHQDCVAPGVAVRELRPPLTELTPLPASYPKTPLRREGEIDAGLPVRQVMLDRRARRPISKRPISRNQLLAINHVAFRGGSFFPMFPDGPHVACIRPFWIVQDVTGLDKGIWYFDPAADEWKMLRGGTYRREAKYIAGDQTPFGEAAAVCVMTANLHQLMTQGGPDAYRLAHLEAGICAQRIYLAATSLNLAAHFSQDFYDEDSRLFLGLGKTGWEVLALTAVGA